MVMDVSILTHTVGWGGTEVHTLQLAEELQRRGHRVRIVALAHDLYAGRQDRVPVQRLDFTEGGGSSLEALGFRECLRLLRQSRATVGVLAKNWFGMGSWRLDAAARFAFRRFLTIEHSPVEALPPRTSRRYCGIPGPALWWRRMLWRRRLRSFGPQAVVCVSRTVRDRLVHSCGFPLRKVRTIHNGVDTDRFRPNPAARRTWRRRWQVSEKTVVFGAVGRLSWEKRLDHAVGQLARLCERHPDRDVRLVLIGEGPERDALAGLAQRCGVADRVIFTGFQARAEEPYAALDYLVLPSRWEGLPLALLEAMACTCPAIAYGVGGVPEVLTSPALGWLVPPGDEVALLNAMREALLLSPNGDTGRMGQSVREHVRTHFNARTQFAKLADLIEECAVRRVEQCA